MMMIGNRNQNKESTREIFETSKMEAHFLEFKASQIKQGRERKIQ